MESHLSIFLLWFIHLGPPKISCLSQVHKYFLLQFFLKFYSVSLLYLDPWFFSKLFLYTEEVRVEVNFFTLNILGNIFHYVKDYLVPIELTWHPSVSSSQLTITGVHLFLDSLFYSIDIYVYLRQTLASSL